MTGIWQSWTGDKAIAYRRLNGLSDDLRARRSRSMRMVYGNAGGTSGAGVAFTRDPASGETFAVFRFPVQCARRGCRFRPHRRAGTGSASQRVLPGVEGGDASVSPRSSSGEFRDMQEFEFTVEDGRFHILQTRAGQAHFMGRAADRGRTRVDEGLLDPAAALARLGGHGWISIERVSNARDSLPVGARALPRDAPPASAWPSGTSCSITARAAELAEDGRSVILVRGQHGNRKTSRASRPPPAS